MAQTLYVGIDVSGKSNTVCLMDGDGEQLEKVFTMTNNYPGAQRLEDHIVRVMEKKGFGKLKIGAESTAFFDLHLVDFLASSERLEPYDTLVYQLNPRLVSGFKKAYAHNEKTDTVDAFVIADRLRFGRLPEPYQLHEKFIPLRRLTRYRSHLVHTIVKEKNYFLSHLFLKYSSFFDVKPFSKTFGETSLSFITDFASPEEVAEMPLETLIDFLIRESHNSFAEPEKIAALLKKVAHDSYRLKPSLLSSVHFILSSTARNIRALEKSLKETDKAIEEEFSTFPTTLLSVPGIGPVFGAGIFSEVGDITRFRDDDDLAKFAGLTWRRNQSGQYESEETRMAKNGNEHLRYYLYEAANALKVHNAEYKAYYTKKYHEVPKHQHKRALALTARKLVRLIFALLKKGQLYQYGR